MSIDLDKFSEFLILYSKTHRSGWIKELYSLIEQIIDNEELPDRQKKIETEKMENVNNIKLVIFEVVFDIVLSRKSNYLRFEFDNARKNIQSLKPKIYLKSNEIKSLVKKILLPYNKTNSNFFGLKQKLTEIENENTHLSFYKKELDSKVEFLQIALKNEREKRLRQQKYKNCPDKQELNKLASECRKKNGSVNYSKLGKILGRSHITAKKWCSIHSIS